MLLSARMSNPNSACCRSSLSRSHAGPEQRPARAVSGSICGSILLSLLKKLMLCRVPGRILHGVGKPSQQSSGALGYPLLIRVCSLHAHCVVASIFSKFITHVHEHTE